MNYWVLGQCVSVGRFPGLLPGGLLGYPRLDENSSFWRVWAEGGIGGFPGLLLGGDSWNIHDWMETRFLEALGEEEVGGFPGPLPGDFWDIHNLAKPAFWGPWGRGVGGFPGLLPNTPKPEGSIAFGGASWK